MTFTSSTHLLTLARKVPYLPTSARLVRNIPPGDVPYISLVDLIVFKIDSCGLRRSLVPRMRDALDAAALLEHAARHQPLQLNYRKERLVRRGLPDVVEYGGRGPGWWHRRLGLDGHPRRHNHPPLLISERHHAHADMQCEEHCAHHAWDGRIRDFWYHDQPGSPCPPHSCPRHVHGPCRPGSPGHHQDSHGGPMCNCHEDNRQPYAKPSGRQSPDSRQGPRRRPSSRSDPCLSARLGPSDLRALVPEGDRVYHIVRGQPTGSGAGSPVASSGKPVYEMSGALGPKQQPSRPSRSTTTTTTTTTTTAYMLRPQNTENRDAKTPGSAHTPAHTSKPPASGGGSNSKRAVPAATAAAKTPVASARQSWGYAGANGSSHSTARPDNQARPAAKGATTTAAAAAAATSQKEPRRVWLYRRNSVGGGLGCFIGSSCSGSANSGDGAASGSIQSYVRVRPEVVFVKAQRVTSKIVGSVEQVDATGASKKVRFSLSQGKGSG